MKTFTAFIFLLITYNAFSQNSDTTFLNFWIGHWDAYWYEANGKDSVKATGENNIERTLGGKVIHEHFKTLSGQNKGFEGESWSVMSKANKNWQQTWVDNQGAYIDLLQGQGSIGEPAFVQHFMRNGKEMVARMVFKNIKPDSFTWDWESSSDGGKTFILSWRIFYERKK